MALDPPIASKRGNLRTGQPAMWGSFIACGLVGVICWFAYRANEALIEANRWTNHTLEVIAELRGAQASLRGASADTRAFVTSGDEEYARTIERQLTDAATCLSRLADLTSDNPVQSQRVREASERALQRGEAMRVALARYRFEPEDAAEEYLRDGIPVREMSLIINSLDLIAVVEQGLLREREAVAARSTERSRVFLFGGGVAVVIVLVGAVILVWREGSNRLRLEGDLREAALKAEAANVTLGELNNRLEDANEGLVSSNKELEAFSYTVSHDLRAPLRSIDGFSRILLEEHSKELPPEATRYLGRVRAGAQQMGALIDDLLAFSRLGRQPIRSHQVDLGAISRQIVAQLKDERPDREVEVTIDPMPVAAGDVALLRQVMSNLIANAFKFTRGQEKPKIHVGFKPDGAAPAYFVRDNGVGFDMAYADKLFGVFQRLHRADEFEGTGVGLAIVQRIVQRHGGRVWAEGRINEGAAFWFQLPGGSTR